MASKALLLLALLASAAVLAAAADQQTLDSKPEKATASDAAGSVEDDWNGGGASVDQYGHACEYGCCHRVYHGGCQRCCPPGGARRPKVKN